MLNGLERSSVKNTQQSLTYDELGIFHETDRGLCLGVDDGRDGLCGGGGRSESFVGQGAEG